MTDVTTGQKLRVSTDGSAGPYIELPYSQLDEVVKLLNEQQVFHWVEEHVVSWNGQPAIAVIDLGRNADAASVQRILDGDH